MSFRHLQKAMRLPGPPTCSFCGADDADIVLAGARAFICAECVEDTTSATDVTPATATCSLCGRSIGSRYGFFWRQRRPIALARGGRVVCAPCLQEAQRAVLWHRSHRSAFR